MTKKDAEYKTNAPDNHNAILQKQTVQSVTLHKLEYVAALGLKCSINSHFFKTQRECSKHSLM